MHKYLLKTVSLLLIITFISVSSFGCSMGKSANIKTSVTQTTINSVTTWEVPPVEIKIPVYERGYQGQSPADNSFWAKWISEKALSDINVKVTYISIPRQQNIDKFNMLLAANDAPDVIFSYDYPTISAFYGRGAFQEIPMEVLDKNGPNLKKWIGEEILKYGMVNGKLYYIPARRPDNYSSITMIRKDWLEKLGIEAPTTLEEQYAVLKAFKEKDPGGLGAENVVPWGINMTSVRSQVVNYPWRPDNLPEEELAMYSDVSIGALTWGPEKERIRYFNKLYNEGLISPEFALDKDMTGSEADFTNGKVGIYSTFLSKNPPLIQTLMKNVPTAKLAVISVNTLYKGKPPTGRAYWPFGMLSGINRKSKNIDSVIKFFDWMTKPEILSMLQYGIEGKNYTKVNGIIKPVIDFEGNERLLNGTNKDYWCLATESIDLGDDKKNMEADASIRAPEGFEYLEEQNYIFTKEMKQIPDFLFNKPMASLAENSKTLAQKWDEALIKLIMGKPDDFEKTYAVLAKDYLANGYQQILDEKKQQYREIKAGK